MQGKYTAGKLPSSVISSLVHTHVCVLVPLACFVEVGSCLIVPLLFSQERNWITCYLGCKLPTLWVSGSVQNL
jgi:hypothetical protein